MSDTFNVSVIIPILSTQNSIENLNQSIENILSSALDAQFVVVIDRHQGDSISSEVESLHQRKGFEIYSGNFGSPGAARNFGLTKSNREWIWFIDSDDVVKAADLASTLNSENLDGFDIIVGEYDVFNLDSHSTERIRGTTLQAVAMNPGIWRHLFRRKILPVEPFPLYRMGEDQFFLARSYANSFSILRLNESIYTYFTGGRSNLTSKPEARNELFRATKEFRSQFVRGMSGENVLVSRMYTRQVITILKYLNLRLKIETLAQFLWTCLLKPSLIPNAASVVRSLVAKGEK
jgi:glycosyltransferase involved in cell wall biosynthesis